MPSVVILPCSRAASPFSSIPNSQLALVKLVDRKNALTAADTLNDPVLPYLDRHGVAMLGILTDPPSEYCGNRESHEYALYLDLNNIAHTRTRTKNSQTNGIGNHPGGFYLGAFRSRL